jgi:hypothetical protein
MDCMTQNKYIHLYDKAQINRKNSYVVDMVNKGINKLIPSSLRVCKNVEDKIMKK